MSAFIFKTYVRSLGEKAAHGDAAALAPLWLRGASEPSFSINEAKQMTLRLCKRRMVAQKETNGRSTLTDAA